MKNKATPATIKAEARGESLNRFVAEAIAHA